MSRIVSAAALFFLCALLTPVSADEGVERRLEPAVERLAAGLPGQTVVSFGTFTYADKKVGSAFSRYLEEALGAVLARDRRFEVFRRDKLDEILSAQEINLSDLVDQKSAVKLGQMKGIQALLSGTFFDRGADVQIYLELLSVEKGTVWGRADTLVPKTAVPASVSILPDNYADAMELIEQLSQVQATQGFQVKAWCERGDGGVFRDGEKLVVRFFSNRDCFIKIYHVDVAGKAQLIFPNQFYRDNSIAAGRIYRIPDGSYPFSFDLGSPYGTELIKVVASTVAFTDVEAAFQDMGKATKGLVTRGLNVSGREGLGAEAMFRYTIVR